MHYNQCFHNNTSMCGPLAQSVERRADNAKVESSRLSWTICFFLLSTASSMAGTFWDILF